MSVKVEKPMVTYGCTKGQVATTLAGLLHNGTLASYVSASPSSPVHIEPSFTQKKCIYVAPLWDPIQTLKIELKKGL